ncbi:Chromo domain protein Chp1p, putative [Talaromyces stipitatus ATCC 10500]|uniref:Chromo domain protein Chp1p, putative n=1 Tax=Talaromyces stipitatus (strain ATCC 10500 / CBS 375.48 / QM 6759 / NRRL 1006) TaxID=441959 RepID=B8LZ96_TALSN|nr:Chromo domain protein Chp1p, putative [Talaromyces stipitatus ATCC 10500]EED21649.1 Chromo domain protein Chp1p, putative [Talaromyces stipitatus ATCC 10500]
MASPPRPQGLGIQTPDLNDVPTSTVAAVEHDEDDISLTSTVESEFQDEYEVETIHAQEIINGQRMYLVKWKGYSDSRCTWEPRESFNTKEILREWKHRKRQIRRGLIQPFDVEAWQAECEALENARQERKRRRREKRARLGLPASENQESQNESQAIAEPTKEPDTVAPSSEASSDEEPLMARRSLGQNSPSNFDNTQSGSPNQPGNIAINNQPKPATARPPPTCPIKQTARPTNQTARQTERPRAASPKPVDIKVVDGRIQRRDLANVLNRARQQPSASADKNKTWKLFQTTHRFEKASRQDPEPNRNDLELQSPKTWSPFQMSSFLRKHQEKDSDNSLFVEQDEVPEAQQTTVPQTPSVSTESPVLPSQQLNAAEPSPAIPPSTLPAGTTLPSNKPTNNSAQGVREGQTKKKSDYFPTKNQPCSRVLNWYPNGTLWVGKRQLRDPTDILIRLSYGPEAVEIGDTLLCNCSFYAREIIFQLKYDLEIRLRFEELCTLERFRSLSRELNNEVFLNGFIRSYPDTKPGLDGLENLLLDKDIVAIARICPDPSKPDYGLTLICYPAATRSFQFLNRRNYCAPSGTLRIAGIRGILPRHLREVAPAKNESMTRKISQRPERQGRYEDAGKPQVEGLNTWRFPSQAIPSTPRSRPDDSSLGYKERVLLARNSRSEAPAICEDQAPGVPPSGQSNILSNPVATDQDDSADAHFDAMDTSSDSTPEANEDSIEIITSHAPVSNDIDVPSPAPLTLNEQYSNQGIEEGQDVHMLDISNPENIKVVLENFFLTNYNITYDNIAAVTSHATVKQANCFYLWFPEDADADFQVLEQFLENHFAIVLSNRKQNDWEKFTKSSSGVALFHHTFLHYSDMPGFHKLTMGSSFNFWNVSLATAIPNIEPKTHFQRLFPQGTGYLMAEDFMLQERDAAIMVLAWFREASILKFPGTIKMMFRPNVLQWLDWMSEEDPRSSAELLPRFAVMAVLIGDTACYGDSSNWPVEARDLDCFYNPSLESPVVSLAEMPKIEPADGFSGPGTNKTQEMEQQKDADLLCEVFAAWAILNAASLRKFNIITHNKPMDRWQKWQHIEIIQGANDFFRKSNINKDYYAKWLSQSSAALSPSKAAAALPVPASGASATTPTIPHPSLNDRVAPWNSDTQRIPHSKSQLPPTLAPANARRPSLNETAATWNSEAHKLASFNKGPPAASSNRRQSR